ncbi:MULTISPECIES: hypothetical protein [unclassified Streptomyces]|uniref:hypothetical protein n=1 Tax=unclassified Streptomyces TaxID=2593676 RepID=UPI0006F65F12|nr:MULTISPECIES: hypothetical protein [unclassified Streptomyces]KQX50947.1 hypothetical protein ASD33_13135 [Streptomyces sp. Root1304]KRA85113.1 hypothetical protein ASE09_13140 [Streptomyces sp. Root66D1]
MSPQPVPTVAPATPAGRPPRPERGRHRWIALLLVLAALFGSGAATVSGGAELRPATAAPASDPGGETHDTAATEAGLPGRARRHRTGLRPVRPAHLRRGGRDHRDAPAPAPVPAPRGDALRCVVMRC